MTGDLSGVVQWVGQRVLVPSIGVRVLSPEQRDARVSARGARLVGRPTTLAFTERSPGSAGSVARLMGSLIKKRRKRMRKKKHKKMLRRTRHQRRK